MQRKVIRRDSRGHPYLDRARSGDDEMCDVRDFLRPGERLAVPLTLMDSADAWKQDMSRHRDAVRSAQNASDTLVINTSAPPTIVDGFGGTEGLNRPGARYLVAGHRTTDHARLVTAAHMREEAYRAYDRAAAEQYKHPSERSPDSDLMGEPERQTDAMPMQDVATMERAHAERMQALYDEVDRLDAERWRKAR